MYTLFDPGAALDTDNEQRRATARNRTERSYIMGKVYPENEYATILEAELVVAPAFLADAFHDGDDTWVRRNPEGEIELIRRMRVVHNTDLDIAVSVSVSWFRGGVAEVCPMLLEVERIQEGTPKYLHTHTGMLINSGNDDVCAAWANEIEARHLDVEYGSPVCRTRSLQFGMNNLLIEYSESTSVPGRWGSYPYAG
jgi:hypothetical protein